MKILFAFVFVGFSTLLHAQYSGTFGSVKFDIKSKPVCVYELDQAGTLIRKETYVELKKGVFKAMELSFDANELQSIYQYSILTKQIDVERCKIHANELETRRPKDFYNLYIVANADAQVESVYHYASGPTDPVKLVGCFVSFTDKSVAEGYLKKFMN